MSEKDKSLSESISDPELEVLTRLRTKFMNVNKCYAQILQRQFVSLLQRLNAQKIHIWAILQKISVPKKSENTSKKSEISAQQILMGTLQNQNDRLL
jgi:hypothetical protein